MSDTPKMIEPNVRVRTRQSFPGQIKPVPGALPVAKRAAEDNETPTAANEPAFGPEPYAVGYGRPPKHSQFQKGRSGNSKGRPKGSKNARTIARQLLDRKTTVTIDGKKQKMSSLEIGLFQQVKRFTEKGDLKSLQFMTSLAEDHASSMQRGPSTQRAENEVRSALDPQDLTILEHHHRKQLLAKGVSPDVIDLMMVEMGFMTEGETP